MWLALLAPWTLAGEFDGQASVDALTARSQSTDPGSGQPEALSSTELGMRVRLDLLEVDDRLNVQADYRGREPIAGEFQNFTHRLLYTARVGFEVVEDRLTVGAGRFIAPSALLLPVDGGHIDVDFTKESRFTLFGGRRGFSQSRRNLGFDTVLPAVGGRFGYTTSTAQFQALGAYAQDQAVLTTAGLDEETKIDHGSSNAMVSGAGMAHETLWVGGNVAFAEQANYVLGPTWADLEVDVEAEALWRGLVWLQWEPRQWLEVDYDLHHQRVGMYRAGTIEGEQFVADLVEPNFTDSRVRAGVAPWKRGWIRGDVRYRARADKNELRTGGGIEITDFGVKGPYLDLKGFLDSVNGDVSPAQAANRAFWRAAAGYRNGGFDAELGAAFTERSVAPVSSRQALLTSSDPTTSNDLQPFVLQAQDIVFARAFVSSRKWFGGLDFEQNTRDGEFRVFVQTGALTGVKW